MVILRRIALCILFIGAINAQDGNEIRASKRNIKTQNVQQITPLDLLIEDLKDQQWAEDEMLCFNKILSILNNVKNSTLWATWIWDSMQSPTGIFYGSRYQFGNYDQCLKAPWLETHSEYRTKYCLADIKLSSEEPQYTVIVDPHTTIKTYINSMSKYGATFNLITSGVCVPVECNSKAISKIVRSLFKHTHLGLSMPIANVSINPCEVAGDKAEFSTVHYLILFGIAFAVITTMICTVLSSHSKNSHQNDHFGNKIIKAFCITENIKSLYKDNDNDIASLHGLKSITTAEVVILHVWIINNMIGFVNLLDVDKNYEKYDLNSLTHTSVVVDTHLMISGLVMIKGLMSSNKFEPWLLILKRYLRFASVIGLIFVISIHMVPHLSDGPIWNKMMQPHVDICKKNWWITMLMLGNYVDTVNTCYPILWTIPCDFHLSIVAVLIFTLYRKHRRLAIATFTILFIAATIWPGVVTYQNKLPAVPSMNISSFNHYRSNLLENPTYIRSHLRAGPYLVGIAVGYLISIYKLDKRSNIIPTTYATIGFVVTFCLCFKIIAIGGIFQDINRPYNVWEASLFISLNRSFYAIDIACLIAFCEYGRVPFASAVLKSQPLLSYSKLAYGTYLLHSIIYSRVIASTRTPLSHDMCLLFFNSFGLMAFCALLSLLVHLAFVAPMNKIINIIFESKKNKKDCEIKELECNNGVVSNKLKKTL